MDCIFCRIDANILENTIIEETEGFIVKTSLGALVPGYLLIISKRHILSMAELNLEEMVEYKSLIKKYRNIFYKIYGKYPILFEHGTINSLESSASIIHAHTHIVNYNFSNEKAIIESLNMVKLTNMKEIKSSYIYYLSQDNIEYYTVNYENKSQLMRILIAKGLGIEEKYNWRIYPFLKNIKKTIHDIENFNKKRD